MTGYADVNGLRLYYEASGVGEPLILLHGGLGSTAMSSEIRPLLAEGRRVIAVDLQGHGRTADVERPISYLTMADDISTLIGHLRLEKADVMGYSLGAGVALRLAIQHPSLVRKLVIVSTPFRRDGWYPEILDAISQMDERAAERMMHSPLYQQYARVAPHPEKWPVLVTKLRDMLGKDYDWSAEVAAIRLPVLLAFADADSIHPEHIVEFFELLGGGQRDGGWDGSGRPASRLAILPGLTHYNIISSRALVEAVRAFLEAT
ncbi:MAG TPA: alpha/beta hydrolase [Bryobacteraceae bacterium]|nr:alpha/beta hydrolase [Bryobacteraceae bacterium]